MTPQFVDFNADGYTDIVTGTFDGSPHVSYGSAEGFKQPKHILDAEGERMILDQWWDHEKSQWLNTDGEQCIAAVAFDWDDDGDYDLLLGDYKKGHLYLRENAGTNAEPKFSTENVQITMGEEGVPFAVEGGMSAPRLVDWDADGLIDIVTGGMKGGVFLYRNTGEVGAPAFSMPETIIAKGKVEPDGPKFPTEGIYVEAADYDGDDDLDLLVGGYATWQPNPRELTEEEEQRLAELDEAMEDWNVEYRKLFEPLEEKIADKTDEEVQEIYDEFFESEEVKAMMERQQELWQETTKLRPVPQRQAGVWLYRRT